MDGIAVSAAMFLLKGIPEGLLVAWAMHIFTNTKIEKKKYLLLSMIIFLATYLIRFLPITLGINTVLSLFVMVFSYQIIYRVDLSRMIRVVAAAVIILVLTAVSEILNYVVLTILYGAEMTDALVTSSDQLTQALSTMPSTVFLALLTLLGYVIASAFRKRKKANGKTGKETGE